ncbi:unnamed protein product [Ilex paraguariensis]|uniref:Uncharacterized protein n=1 Tax=Ilex paraguariensis TaxID=185542 RepID=A0ABC8UVT7_9AQUA
MKALFVLRSGALLPDYGPELQAIPNQSTFFFRENWSLKEKIVGDIFREEIFQGKTYRSVDQSLASEKDFDGSTQCATYAEDDCGEGIVEVRVIESVPSSSEATRDARELARVQMIMEDQLVVQEMKQRRRVAEGVNHHSYIFFIVEYNLSAKSA